MVNGNSGSGNEGAPIFSAGSVLGGRYELVRRIGIGGMGEVWSARHVALDKPVAIKLLHAFARSARARLLLEAKLMAGLKHDAVVQVFDYGETDAGIPFFVMELVEGSSLADRIENDGCLPLRESVHIALTVAAGLGAAHAAGVIHRDVKPDNILLARDASGLLRPKIVDFGIALARRDGVDRLTANGGVVGTPEYMAPEIILGEEPGPSSDVWGLAITFYETVSGISPFRAPYAISAFRRVLDEPLPYPRDVVGFDAALWRFLTRALRKDPRERTQTVVEVHAELAAWLASSSSSARSTDEARADTVELGVSRGVDPKGPTSPLTRDQLSPSVAAQPMAQDPDGTPPSFDDVIRRNLGRG